MRVLPALLSCALLLHASAVAQDMKDTEKRLQRVRGELHEVSSQRQQLQGKREDIHRRLRDADQRVATTQNALSKTREALQRDSQELTRLQQERAQLAQGLQARKDELAALLRATRRSGDAPAIKALLAQQDVAAAEREMRLQGYVQRAQVQRIRELSAHIARSEAVAHEIEQRQLQMAAAQQTQALQLTQLEAARKQRAQLLAQVDQQVKEHRDREQVLGNDAKALQQLLRQLRAAAAKAARDAERARAEALRQAKAGNKGAVKRPPMATAPLRKVGGLAWPVAGDLLAGYGGRLPDGRRSSGVLIAAPAGTPVKAVADGTVVFADWMTGYGNILIVDHGNGYMSLYAHAEGLLRKAGEVVKRATPLATVGTSGGQEKPALYFELRHNGAPVNPSAWLTRQ